MIELRVDPSLPAPPSQQLQDAILDAVATGALAVGDRLPSVRTVAAEALVNPNTVGKAWRALELMSVVEGKNGSGVYVRDGGVEVAKRLRREATLQDFRRAADAALRAGHTDAALAKELDRTHTRHVKSRA